jgi:hypothetical protein
VGGGFGVALVAFDDDFVGIFHGKCLGCGVALRAISGWRL